MKRFLFLTIPLSILNKKLRNYLIGPFLLLLFLSLPCVTYADRIGALVEEGDGSPADYAYKLIFPNGTISIANAIATYSPVVSGVTDTGPSSYWDNVTNQIPDLNVLHDYLKKFDSDFDGTFDGLFESGVTFPPDQLDGDNIDDNKVDSSIVLTAAPTSGATEIPTSGQVYTFCETTQDYFETSGVTTDPVADVWDGVADQVGSVNALRDYFYVFDPSLDGSLEVKDISSVTNYGTYTPPAGRRVRALLTATNADPSGVTVAETNASDGDELICYNSGTSEIEFANVDTVMQMPYTVRLAQFEEITFVYQTGRWAPKGAPMTAEVNFDIINVKQKTFSFSGVAGTYQYSSISGSTVTMTDGESCGYGMHDSATSGYYKLPDPDPGSNNVGALGQLIISAAGQDVTVTDASGVSVFVNGTATIAKTGAVITTSTVGEYFTWEPINVLEYGWRWAIRIKDD